MKTTTVYAYTEHENRKCSGDDDIDMNQTNQTWTIEECREKCDSLTTCKAWYYHDDDHCHYFDGPNNVKLENENDNICMIKNESQAPVTTLEC